MVHRFSGSAFRERMELLLKFPQVPMVAAAVRSVAAPSAPPENAEAAIEAFSGGTEAQLAGMHSYCICDGSQGRFRGSCSGCSGGGSNVGGRRGRNGCLEEGRWGNSRILVGEGFGVL